MTIDSGKILITGASGFVGAWLAAEMLSAGADVAGLGAPGPAGLPPRIGDFAADGEAPGGEVRFRGPAGGWTCAAGDLRDREIIDELLQRHRPAVVFHLAAQSSAARSFTEPEATFSINAGGTLSLLEAIRRLPEAERPRMVAAGSADEYGVPDGRSPLHERSALRPTSPYGASKAAQSQLCLQYHRAFGVPVMVTRAFSHTGPGQSTTFLFPSVASQVVAAERGETEPVLKVGDLSHYRDYMHVRDAVRAYRLIAEHGRAGQIYNICSGRALRLSDGVAMLAAAAEIPVRIDRDPDRIRSCDIPLLVGDGTKLRRETGWKPETTVETALRDLLGWCRKEI